MYSTFVSYRGQETCGGICDAIAERLVFITVGWSINIDSFFFLHRSIPEVETHEDGRSGGRRSGFSTREHLDIEVGLLRFWRKSLLVYRAPRTPLWG